MEKNCENRLANVTMFDGERENPKTAVSCRKYAQNARFSDSRKIIEGQ